MSFLFSNVSYSQYNYILDSIGDETDTRSRDSDQSREYFDRQSLQTNQDTAAIEDFKDNSNFHVDKDLSNCTDIILPKGLRNSLECANKQHVDGDFTCKKNEGENNENDMCVYGPETNSSQNGSGLLNRIVKKIISSKQTKVTSEVVDNHDVFSTALLRRETKRQDGSYNESNDLKVEVKVNDVLLNSGKTRDHGETERSFVSADLSLNTEIQTKKPALPISNELRGTFSKKVEETGDILDSGENDQTSVGADVQKSLKVQNLIPELDVTNVQHEAAGVKVHATADHIEHGDRNDLAHAGSQNIVPDLDDVNKPRELDASIERNAGLQSNPNNVFEKRNDPDYSELDTDEKQTPKRFFCEICNKSFTTNKSLIRHNFIHDKEVKYRHGCGLCGREFREAYNLKVHMFSHTGERLFSCEICGKTYNNRSNLNRHAQVHTGRSPPKRKYPCKLCDKVFSASGSRSRHMTLHTGDKKYDKKCIVCDRSFRDIHNLKKHMITHTGEKNFCCETCGKRFASKFSMQNHEMLIHTDTTPRFTCNICQKFFKSQYSLRRHESKHDDGKKAERSCDTCGAQFSDKYALKRHLSKHSEDKQQSCSVCGIQFSEAAVLKLHLLVHS